MGWLFSYDTHKTITDLVAELSDPKRFSEGWTLVMSRRVGNHHWYLVRDARGHDHIGLDLMKGRNLKLNEGPGHKGMGESDGPYYWDCPLAILDNARAPEGRHAHAWRHAVRAWHAKRAAHRSGLREGARLKFGPHTYVLGPKLPGRKGWTCQQLNEGREPGCEMRMPLSFVARAEILS